MAKTYDVIVVGARCAGSPAAMLLARRGHRVLLLDRATFPSDTLSTHVVHPAATAALERWDLLERLVATGCPPIHTYAFDFGPFAIEGTPRTDGMPPAYCPRRIVLDEILVRAAAESGAEVREGFAVEELLIEDGRVAGVRGRTRGGVPAVERATVVVGADGRASRVAAAVGAGRYHERPALQAGYYSYWSGLPMAGRFEIYIRDRRGFAAADTHEGLTMIVGGWPYAELAANRSDIDGNFRRAFDLVPAFAERIRGARRESKWAGTPTPNFFRTPYGPGWALVGDAGYLKDPITAQGILDAFRDAELCANALDEFLSHRRPFEEAMADYQRVRDASALAMYDFTCQLARMEPPPPEMQALFGAVARNRAASDDFVRMNAATISPERFFAPDNVGAILAAAGSPV